MYKIHKKIISTLLVASSLVLVNGCSSSNEDKNQIATPDPFLNQPTEKKEHNTDKNKGPIPPEIAEQKTDVVLPPQEEVNNEENTRKQSQNKIKQEIIDTEKNYNKSLHLLKNSLLEPLKEKFKEDPEVQKFTDDLLQAINPLIVISDSLQEDLQAKVAAGEVINKGLGEVLQKHIPFFNHFSNFLARYADILTHFNRLLQTNKVFEVSLKGLEKNPEFNLLGFSDYMIMPVQRFPRYKLLLQDLLKNMSQEDNDYEFIQETLNKITVSLAASNANTPQMPRGKKQREISLSSLKRSLSELKKK